MYVILELSRSFLKLSMHLLSKKLGKIYHHHGGEGPVWFVPVPDREGPVGVALVPDGEGSVDACREACCTKDHLQCLVSMMQLKCEY